MRSNSSSSSSLRVRTSRAAQVRQPGHEAQVLDAGQQLVDRRELPGEADRRADLGGLRDHVLAGDVRGAGVGLQQRGQDADGRGLAGAVGAEEGEHLARCDVEVDAVEHGEVAVGLAQPPGDDDGAVIAISFLCMA